MPGGKIGGEEECRERDGDDDCAAGPMNRLASDQSEDQQERKRERQSPETGGDRADAAVADEEWTGGERDIATEQGDERPAVRACIVSIRNYLRLFRLRHGAPIAESRFMPSLFDPIELSPALQLRNRILMAPLTRGRATKEAVPTDLQRDYYAQRSGAGLIISEATGISREGLGWPYAPGLWSDAQVEGWKPVVGAVHAAGGKMVAQLWHMGRIVPTGVSGLPAVSASAVRNDALGHSYGGKEPYPEPRAASLDDIERIIGDYASAARNAISAGFDGVQIHGANGYLIDQFLQDSTNQRCDEYGGPIENRARLLLEVTDAVVSVWGADRVGVHLAPRGDAHDMGDSDIATVFLYAARELGKRKLAFLCARESHDKPALGPSLKQAFGGIFIANEGFTAESARLAIQSGTADAVAFGKSAIANPDLVARFRHAAPLNPPEPSTFYNDGPVGYTDYPLFETANI